MEDADMISGGWRLGRRPALDGLRGVAILMVMWCHAFTLRGPYAFHLLGPAGVTIFFVLSGFLITSLLLDELDATGRIASRAFYLRRARRLAPALLVMLAVVLAVALIIPGYSDLPTFVGALTWSTNWIHLVQVAGHLGGDPGMAPLGHTWSLAVEEQFYLVWPLALILVARFGRRFLFWVTLAGCAISAGLPLVIRSEAHIYYGSDTRAMPLLAGAALAIWMRARPEGRTVRLVVPLGLTWIVLIAWTDQFRIGSQLIALCAVAIIWGVTQGEGRTFLNAAWLRLIGRKSYALYLWHLPVYVLLLKYLTPSPALVLAIGGLAAAVLAACSWRFVERPFMRHPNAEPAERSRSGLPRSGEGSAATVAS